MNWDEFYMEMAEFVSQKSKDRSTKVGAVIVGENNEILSIGYNGFPRGVDDEEELYHSRPTKYLVTEHAERNAIYNAARQGIRLEGSRLYLMYEPIPCCRCARGVIQSGISEVIGWDTEAHPEHAFPGKGDQWKEDLELAEEFLKQAGVKITKYRK